MDIERAKEILTILADGVNPVTGEVLPDCDSANQVEVVRALNTVINLLDKTKEKNANKESPENAGKPWTEEDDSLLCRMFDEKCSRADIVKHFKRTQGAIASRLVRLGKTPNTDEFRKL